MWSFSPSLRPNLVVSVPPAGIPPPQLSRRAPTLPALPSALTKGLRMYSLAGLDGPAGGQGSAESAASRRPDAPEPDTKRRAAPWSGMASAAMKPLAAAGVKRATAGAAKPKAPSNQAASGASSAAVKPGDFAQATGSAAGLHIPAATAARQYRPAGPLRSARPTRAHCPRPLHLQAAASGSRTSRPPTTRPTLMTLTSGNESR